MWSGILKRTAIMARFVISDRSSISPPSSFLFSEECGSCLVGVLKVGRTDQVFEAVDEIGMGEKINGGEGVFLAV